MRKVCVYAAVLLPAYFVIFQVVVTLALVQSPSVGDFALAVIPVAGYVPADTLLNSVPAITDFKTDLVHLRVFSWVYPRTIKAQSHFTRFVTMTRQLPADSACAAILACAEFMQLSTYNFTRISHTFDVPELKDHACTTELCSIARVIGTVQVLENDIWRTNLPRSTVWQQIVERSVVHESCAKHVEGATKLISRMPQ